MPLRHSAEQIVIKLDRAGKLILEGASMTDAASAIGVSEKTFVRWRKNYLAMRADQLRYVRELESEIDRLRSVIEEIEGAAAA